MTRMKTYSRAAAMLLAVLMMLGMLFASMPTASAANEGTLTIHKLSKVGVAAEDKETSKTYYENASDGLFYEYLAGAKYTVYKIGTFGGSNVGGTISTVFTADMNLVMMAGKTFGSATVPGDIDLAASKAEGLSGSETGATTATGPLSITSGLDANGVYLIVESTLPADVSTGADFIITVPMYNTVTDNWETTVNAYPKNSATDGTIGKTVTDVDGTPVTSAGNTFYGNTGSIITYSVGVGVPTDYTTTDTDPAKNYTKFNIVDNSNQFLVLQYGMDPVDGVTITGSGSGVFAAETDYTATYVLGASGTDNVLTVQFTEGGLAKIMAGETLTVSYDAQIQVGAAASTGALVNMALIDFTKGTGSGTINPSPEIPPTTVKIYSFGVKKINDDDQPTPLADATFVLATKNSSGDYEYLSYNSTTEEWDVVAEAAAQTFTTSTSGSGIETEAILQFRNLDPDKTYYLIETAAPTEYIKLEKPVEIKATGTTTDAVYNAYDANGSYVADAGYTLKITNISIANGGIIGGGGLPTTGDSGIYLYLIIGAALMGSAVVFYVRHRKKNKAVQ